MKKTIPVLGVLLLAGTAWAGGTAIKTNVTSIADTCVAGTCDAFGGVCATNTDCDPFGAVSPKSKFSISGAGLVKVQLKGVVDLAGMEATGKYYVALLVSSQTVFVFVLVEVPVDGGKGKAEADLSSLMPPAGEAAYLQIGYLIDPATVPANCPSGNDPANLTGRLTDPDCNGTTGGWDGVVSGS